MIILLQLSITFIALFVTYASVYGLGSLFSTIAYPIMGAGIALEIGKYVAVSYAYQQWGALKKLETFFLTFFIALMMIFTSAGVFSYLGQSYQESYAALDGKRVELQTLEAQVASVKQRVANIESQISNLPSNVVGGRIRLMREYEAERKPLLDQLHTLEPKVNTLKQEVAVSEIHAGPITYMARATGLTVEQSATWIITALTLCLDPFALFLTILMNKLLVLKRKGEGLTLLKSAATDIDVPQQSEIPSNSDALQTVAEGLLCGTPCTDEPIPPPPTVVTDSRKLDAPLKPDKAEVNEVITTKPK
jgi:hypothetical protein